MDKLPQYDCTCGARSDIGDIQDHVITKLNDPDDNGEHSIIGVEDTDAIAAARARLQRRTEIQRKMLETFGADKMTEILDALRV